MFWRRLRQLLVGAAAVALVLAIALSARFVAHLNDAATPPVPAASLTPVTLVPGYSWRVDAQTQNREASYQFPLVNEGATTVTVLNIGRSGPGLDLIKVSPKAFSLAPQANITVTITFRVTNCAEVSTEPWPVPVIVRMSKTSGTVYVALLGAGPKSEWQTAVANAVCQPNSVTIK